MEIGDWGGNASIDGEDVCEVDICLQISCNDNLSILQYLIYLQRHYWVDMYVRHRTLGKVVSISFNLDDMLFPPFDRLSVSSC